MPPRPPLSSPVRHILVCARKMIANKLTVCPTLVCMQWPHVVWCVDCRCWQIGWLVTMWYTCGPKLWYHSLFYTDIAHAWLHDRLQHVNAMLQQNSYCGPPTHKNILNCRFNSVYSPYWGWCAPNGWWFERGCYYWYSHYEHQYFLTKHPSLSLSLSLSLPPSRSDLPARKSIAIITDIIEHHTIVFGYNMVQSLWPILFTYPYSYGPLSIYKSVSHPISGMITTFLSLKT